MIVPDLPSSEAFPAQGSYLGRRVEVLFGYQGPAFRGVIVRDDNVAPGLLIIRLDDGRHVLSLECQYRPLPTDAPTDRSAKTPDPAAE